VEVEAWWALPDAERPWHRELLDSAEQPRRTALRREEDRARFTVATALVKLATGQRLGVSAPEVVIDRRCDDCGRPHGRPRLPGSDLAVSISHSADRVLVALTPGAPVGADVEQIRQVEVTALASHVLGSGESAPGLPEFFRYWTRKEAVVKATGDGLRMPLSQVVVTAPDEPPRLLRYGDRAGLVATMADLDLGEGYAAALAVLASGPIQIRQYAAARVLSSEPLAGLPGAGRSPEEDDPWTS
jgi:4'-phosphopantetheinyl transferase